MIVQKLPWAGIQVTSGETSIVIDPLYHFPTKFGAPREPLHPLSEFGEADAVLVTHLHGDHYDPQAIKAFYGEDVSVYGPQGLPTEAGAGASLNNVHSAVPGDSFQIGGLKATAVESVDGVGDRQVGWVVTDGEKTLFHGGDTLWHGYWWKIAKAHGPIHAACLPVNGAVVQFPGLVPSGQPITMIPEQAVAAAKALQTERLVPIHYGMIHHPPLYTQTPDLLGRLKRAAEEMGVRLAVLGTKDTIEL